MQNISVIVPVYNGGMEWKRALDALQQLSPPPHEIIVVDDGSTDDSRAYAESRGVCVMQTLHPRSGPAVARNLGAARASGEILLFVDSDVLVYPDAVARVSASLADPQVSAIFGSYDNLPGDKGFFSQYRNLFHHYVHQTSQPDAATFWAGCGAIRREIFHRVGGFADYRRPSIEDIELGYRLTGLGYRICLVKGLQVKHLKRWTLRSILQTDIRDRAIPWAELLVRERQLPRDLNLKPAHRISAVLCWLVVLVVFASLLVPAAALLLAPLVIGLVLLNVALYRFLLQSRGFVFMLGGIACHWLYYLYSSAAFAYVVLNRRVQLLVNQMPHLLGHRARM